MIYNFHGARGGPSLAVDADGGRYWYWADRKTYVHTVEVPVSHGAAKAFAHRPVSVESEPVALFQTFHSLRESWVAMDPALAERTRWGRAPNVAECDPDPIHVDAPDAASPELASDEHEHEHEHDADAHAEHQ